MTTTIAPEDRPTANVARPGVRIEARHLTTRTRKGDAILDDASLTIEAGELVAVIGTSGSGKTTLLDALAGVRPADHGTVRFTESDRATDPRPPRPSVGYVPQDDIIHLELPLVRTLRYAAALRLPAGSNSDDIDRVVNDVLDSLELRDRANIPVGSLSGGQRKRASIAVELLTSPQACFLDEPTSGLDPAMSGSLVALLRRLSDRGSTVVFTTHSVQDLAACDRVIVMVSGGRVAFSGPLRDAFAHFGVTSTEAIYDRLADPDTALRLVPPETRTSVSEPSAVAPEPVSAPDLGDDRRAGDRPSPLWQWAALTRRSAETLLRNRLTLAILVGSPALVIAMFAVLFQPGAFGPPTPDPTATVMIAFWIAFAAFFFGLTYGLLQVCSELPIVRREHHASMGLWPYLLAKVSVLVPFLLLVNVAMLVVLRLTDRLPDLSAGTYASLGCTLTLDALAALALGLLASAAVSTTAQAALALPMICFPAVLFAGAIVPVPLMAPVGRTMAAMMLDRWAFEAIAADLDLRESSPASWVVLAGFAVATMVAARVVLGRRATSTRR